MSWLIFWVLLSAPLGSCRLVSLVLRRQGEEQSSLQQPQDRWVNSSSVYFMILSRIGLEEFCTPKNWHIQSPKTAINIIYLFFYGNLKTTNGVIKLIQATQFWYEPPVMIVICLVLPISMIWLSLPWFDTHFHDSNYLASYSWRSLIYPCYYPLELILHIDSRVNSGPFCLTFR